MREANSHYKLHVFVCTNLKKGACCGERGAEELRKELKSWTKENPDWKGRIRVNSSGCLDQCKNGIAIAIYPQNRWLLDVDLDNLDDLKLEITKMMEEPGGEGDEK